MRQKFKMLVNKGYSIVSLLVSLSSHFCRSGTRKVTGKTTLDDAKVTRKTTMEKLDTGELARIAREILGKQAAL